MLAVVSGRFPSGDDVAVTADVAADLTIAVDDGLTLDGVRRAVVGIVEDPSDLGDQFALVAPGNAQAVEHTVLVRTTNDRIHELPSGVRIDGIGERVMNEDDLAAAGALGLAVVVSILVCLVASAGFVVVAQRRLRQLGMLAAVGATQRHLRLVVLANGALVGAVAALAGSGLAWVAWIVSGPSLESAGGRRIDRFDVPWWIVACGMALALVTATVAAWWRAAPSPACLSPLRCRHVHRDRCRSTAPPWSPSS
jgi:putative ABC transport system permease protein